MPQLLIDQAEIEGLLEAGTEHLAALLLKGDPGEKTTRFYERLRGMVGLVAWAKFDARMPPRLPRPGGEPKTGRSDVAAGGGA